MPTSSLKAPFNAAASLSLIQQIRTAVTKLDPEHVRRLAERPLDIGLLAASPAALAAMEDYLIPADITHSRRTELIPMVHRVGDPGTPENFDLLITDGETAAPEHAFVFHFRDPERTLQEILSSNEDLSLALARNFAPFRPHVVRKVIHSISRDNAMFALATALPNIVPNLIELPWAIGEFASDTAFITMNQLRMAFLIAGASDSEIGYREQKEQIASIITGAFGWRALARELVGKIPLGGGLIPKGAIAYAGTYVMGLGLDHLNRLGYGQARAERRSAYEVALERGRHVVEAFLSEWRQGRKPHENA